MLEGNNKKSVTATPRGFFDAIEETGTLLKALHETEMQDARDQTSLSRNRAHGAVLRHRTL